MLEQCWEILKSVVEAYGVKAWKFSENNEEKIEFDKGLRGELYENYDYSMILEAIKKNCQENRIYNIYDMFAMHYIIFRLPEEKNELIQYVMIGAFLEEQEKPNAVQIVEEVGLELYQVKILKNYYYGIPTTNHLRKVIYAIVQMMFPEIVWQNEKTGIFLHEVQKNLHIQIKPVSKMLLKLIEDRYQCENDMLRAVMQGDVVKIERAMNVLMKYQIEARNSSNLRNAKNNLIIMNVLYRKGKR